MDELYDRTLKTAESIDLVMLLIGLFDILGGVFAGVFTSIRNNAGFDVVNCVIIVGITALSGILVILLGKCISRTLECLAEIAKNTEVRKSSPERRRMLNEEYEMDEHPEPRIRTPQSEPRVRTEQPEPRVRAAQPEPRIKAAQPEIQIKDTDPELRIKNNEKPEPRINNEEPELRIKIDPPEPPKTGTSGRKKIDIDELLN